MKSNKLSFIIKIYKILASLNFKIFPFINTIHCEGDDETNTDSNAALPPATKVGLVLGASAAGSLIQTLSTSESSLAALSNLPDSNPPSPKDSFLGDIHTSSVGSIFDLNNLFGLDPNNYLLNYIFSLLGLNLIALFFLCIIIIYLIYIYMYHNINLELK
jgi:hypothetical protein